MLIGLQFHYAVKMKIELKNPRLAQL